MTNLQETSKDADAFHSAVQAVDLKKFGHLTLDSLRSISVWERHRISDEMSAAEIAAVNRKNGWIYMLHFPDHDACFLRVAAQ